METVSNMNNQNATHPQQGINQDADNCANKGTNQDANKSFWKKCFKLNNKAGNNVGNKAENKADSKRKAKKKPRAITTTAQASHIREGITNAKIKNHDTAFSRTALVRDAYWAYLMKHEQKIEAHLAQLDAQEAENVNLRDVTIDDIRNDYAKGMKYVGWEHNEAISKKEFDLALEKYVSQLGKYSHQHPPLRVCCQHWRKRKKKQP